jgi:hypothetical protein
MRQMKEWEEYYAVEPWGDDQHEARNGLLCSLLANIHRDTKARPQPFSMKDFMRGNEAEEVILTDEQIERELDRILGV